MVKFDHDRLVGAATDQPPSVTNLPVDFSGRLLPVGFLSTRDSQIVGQDGTPVRIASVGVTGMNVGGGRLQLVGPFKGLDGHVAAMRAMGFNCVRVDWIDKTLDDPGAMAQLDTFVAACQRVGLKVIFDNHNNEATRADWENAAQQKNGLWFDTGPGTDGTDGAGTAGTVSAAQFQEHWVTFARHWVGNSTVIGFDLRNEPCAHTRTPALWGSKGPTDIHAMYERVGNAILAVNPDVLIICEAVINYKTEAYEGDLSIVRRLPIKLSNPAKLVAWFHSLQPPTSVVRLRSITGLVSLTVQGATWQGNGGYGLVEAVPEQLTFPIGGEVSQVTLADCRLRALEEDALSRRPLYLCAFHAGPGARRIKLLNNDIYGSASWGIGGVGQAVRTDIIGNIFHGGAVSDVVTIGGSFRESLIDANILTDTPGRITLGMGWHNYIRFNEIHQAFRSTWENAEEIYLVHSSVEAPKTVSFATDGASNTLVDTKQKWKRGLPSKRGRAAHLRPWFWPIP